MSVVAFDPRPAAHTRVAFTVYGPPEGAARHRSTKTGHMYRKSEHVRAEERVRIAAAAAWGNAQPLDVPVHLTITSWHARPERMRKARKWAGDGPRPYIGKPDWDNLGKLVSDALTKAGVWTDDTRVTTAHVTRLYLPLDADRLPVGVERVEVVVEVLGEVSDG